MQNREYITRKEAMSMQICHLCNSFDKKDDLCRLNNPFFDFTKKLCGIDKAGRVWRLKEMSIKLRKA